MKKKLSERERLRRKHQSKSATTPKVKSSLIHEMSWETITINGRQVHPPNTTQNGIWMGSTEPIKFDPLQDICNEIFGQRW